MNALTVQQETILSLEALVQDLEKKIDMFRALYVEH